MLALLYDVHGNLAALEAVLTDALEQGATAYLVGGDVALFGPWPLETVRRLRELEPATWIRGNGERWTADPDAAPAPVRATTRAWHGSPVSDVRSFLPEPAADEAELLAGVGERQLVFGHTHVPFRRTSAQLLGAVELVNPGSVGMPFDGDHRAAYALLAPDGTIEQRRVAYDHAAPVVALRERYGDEPWFDIVADRFIHARLTSA